MRALVLAALAAAVLAGCLDPQASSSFAAGAGACADTSAATESGGILSYGGTASCKTANETYEWNNAATQGHVTWGGVAISGSLAGTIVDAAGRPVYAFEIDARESKGIDGPTGFGMPANPVTGPWAVELTFTEFTGTMGLTIRAE